MSASLEQLALEFKDEDVRRVYVRDLVNASIAAQIKVLREQRGLTQAELAERAAMKQPRISLLENVNYDAWSLKTLWKLAEVFDVALTLRFESFGQKLLDADAFSTDSLSVPSFSEDPFVAYLLTLKTTVTNTDDPLSSISQQASSLPMPVVAEATMSDYPGLAADSSRMIQTEKPVTETRYVATQLATLEEAA
jgi:transcriptional regulator with XRE-family HTH domain